MALAAAQLQEVDALKQARLEALQSRFQLEQVQCELEDLRQRVEQDAAQQQQQPQPWQPVVNEGSTSQQAAHCCRAAAELFEVRMQAADDRYKLQLSELELLKQVDALQELQWQLDCVVAQLGLQPDQEGFSEGAAPSGGPPMAPRVDHMLLLSKMEDLRLAQVHLEEHKRRLVRAEGQLAASQARCAVLEQGQQQQQQQQQQQYQQHAATTGPHEPPVPPGSNTELGSGGRELVGELLQDNQVLRRQLEEAEEQYRSLERDYEVELLLKAEAGERQQPSTQAVQEEQQAPYARAAAATPGAGHATWQAQGALHENGERPQAPAAAGASSRDSSPLWRESQPQPPASPTMDHIARRRLEVRLRDKDAQMGKLRGVVQQLEGKLIDSYKRQADLVMRESSWQEQEAQDRRISLLDEEKARLAFAAQAAQAEVEAARKEAAAQRRLAKRLQQRLDEYEQGNAGTGSSARVVELLQKRVKVLEAQCMRMRLQVRSRKEEEEEEEEAVAAAATRRRHGGGGRTAAAAGQASQEGGAAENDSPNREAAGMLSGNAVLEQWQAGKRFQKKVETLQAKLREKTTALVSAQAGRSRAEEQTAQLQEQLLQCQVALKQVQSQLRAVEQRCEPGAMVAVGQWQALVLELEQEQQRYQALERQHATLQRRVPSQTADGSRPEGASQHTGQHTPAAACCSLPASPLGSSSGGAQGGTRPGHAEHGERGRLYCPEQYSGTASNSAADDLAAKLLDKDVQLFDACLQRDQAAAEAACHRRRLHSLLEGLSPPPLDAETAAVVAQARQLAGLPTLAPPAHAGSAAQPASGAAPGKSGAGGGKSSSGGGGGKRQLGIREQELLETVALLKGALERTRKGLESGVSSSKYMQAVDKAKQLRAQCQALEAQVADAGIVREELSRVQSQLGSLHGINSALKSQLKAARERQEEAASVREDMLRAQLEELERTVGERDAQMEALAASTAQVGEEVQVLVAEGLRPADLIQELLLLRPRLRELEACNQQLAAELATYDSQFAEQLEALRADHALLRQRCGHWEGEVRRLCSRHGEPLPVGM